MKNLKLVVLGLLVSSSLLLSAQEDAEVQRKPVEDIISKMKAENDAKSEEDFFTYRIFDEIKPMKEGSHPAYVVEFAGLKDNEVKAMFNDFIKEHGKKPKKVKRSDEFLVEDARLPGVNAGRTFKLYNAFYEVGEVVQTVVWVKTDDGYLSSTSDDHEAMMENLRQYLNHLMYKKSGNELDDEEKVLKDFERDLSKLEKDREKSLDNIEDYKQKIIEEEANINVLDQDIQYKKDDIEVQQASKYIVEERLNEYKAKSGAKSGLIKSIFNKD